MAFLRWVLDLLLHLKPLYGFLLRFSAIFATIGAASYGVVKAGKIDLKPAEPIHHEFFVFIAWSVLAVLLTYWKESRADRITKDHLERKKYLDAYRKQLTKSIGIIQDLGTYKKLGQFLAVQQDILGGVCKLVEDNAGNSQELRVNANLMIPINVGTPRFESALFHAKFLDSTEWDGTKYAHLLQITQWATDDHDIADEEASFPVHKSRNEVLFGAPHAFARDTVFQVCDTHDEKLLRNLMRKNPEGIQDQAVEYFAGSVSVRSFVSVCLRSGNDKVGVLTIQADRPNVFGNRKTYDKELMDDLEPFFVALGAALAAARPLLSIKS